MIEKKVLHASIKLSLKETLKKALSKFSKNILLVDNDIELSGNDIIHMIEPIISHLKSKTSPNDVIAICLPQSIQQVLAILATIVCGRVPMVLKVKKTLKESITNRPVSLLIGSQSSPFSEELRHINISSILLSIDKSYELSCKTFCNSKRVNTFKLLPPGVGMILYTSGSSGSPHGVMIPSQGTLFLAKTLKESFKLNEDTISPIILPLTHTMCINTHFLPTLLAGGRSVLTPATLNLNRTYRNIIASQGNTLALISDLLPYLVEEKKIRKLNAAEKIKILALSGGFITEKDIEYSKNLFPNAIIYKGYGLTEATRIAMTACNDKVFLKDDRSGYQLLPEVEVEIRSSSGEICKKEIPGEIFIKSPTVTKGYYNEKCDLFDDRGFLKSGDFGKLENKTKLVIHGRLDGLLKINGERVCVNHIEKTAMNLREVTRHYKSVKCIPIKKNQRNQIYLFLELNNYHEENNTSLIRVIKRDLKKRLNTPIEIVEKSKFPRANNGKVLINNLTLSVMHPHLS